jgi:hypothetical protein
MKQTIRTISAAAIRSRVFGVALSAALLFCCVSSLRGQSITVRVLNARSGRPLSGQNVTIVWPDTPGNTVVRLGSDGTGKLDIAGKSQFAMLSGPKLGKEPYRIAYINCNEFSMVRVDDVLSRGVVAANLCSSKVSTNSKPGEIVFWGVPLHWWEPDLQ